VFIQDNYDIRSNQDTGWMLIKKRKYTQSVTANIFIFVINNGIRGVMFAHKQLV